MSTARGLNPSDGAAAAPQRWVATCRLQPIHARCGCRVSDRLVPRPTGGPVRLAFVPAQASGRGVTAVLRVGRRSFAGPIESSGAPCHALPGRVGEEGSVNQAYDLAWCRAGWRRGSGDLRVRRSNKRMQQTRGGWRRAGASWSAQSPRTRARSCAPRSLSPVFDGPAGGAPNERSPRAAPAPTPVGRCQELGLQAVQEPHLIGQNRHVIGQNRTSLARTDTSCDGPTSRGTREPSLALLMSPRYSARRVPGRDAGCRCVQLLRTPRSPARRLLVPDQRENGRRRHRHATVVVPLVR